LSDAPMVRLDENNDNDNSLAVVEEPTPATTNATESEINRELEAEFRVRSQVTGLLDEYDEAAEENKNAETDEEEEEEDEEDEDGENTNNEDEEDEDDDENDSNENDDEDEDDSDDGNEQMESREEDFDYGYERDINNQNTNQSDNNDNGDKRPKSIDSNTDCLISEQDKNKISDNDDEDDSKTKEDRDKLKLSPASRKIKSKMLNKYKYKYKSAHQAGDEAKSIKQEKTLNAIKSIARASATTAAASSQPAKKIVSAKRVILPVVPLPQTSKLAKKPPTAKSSDEALISNPIRAKSSIKKKLYSDKLSYFGATKHDEEESGEEDAASKKSSAAVKFASEPSELSASSSGSLVTVTAPASTSNLNDPLMNAKLKLGKGKNTPDFVRMKTGGGGGGATTSGSQFINSSDSSLSQHFTKLSKTFDEADAKFNKSTSSMMILDDDNQEYTYDEQDSEDKNSSNNSNSISYSNLPIGSIEADDLGNNLGLNRRRRRDQNSLFNRFSLSSTFSTASNYNSFYSSSKPVNLAHQLDEEDKSDDPDKKLSHNDTHNDDLDDLHGKSVSFMSMTSAIDTTHNKNNETIPFINQSQLSISSHHHIHPINKSLSSSLAFPNNNVNINQRNHLLNQISPSSQDQFMDSVEEDL
jgi:segregation and condensation protein B